MASRASQRADGSSGAVVPDALARRSRVVSVSPARAAGAGPFAAASGPTGPDQQTFDAFARTLRSLVDEASHVAARLDQQIETIGHAPDASTQVVGELQDRLRLGARMLKAFESQVGRVESALLTIETQQQGLDERLERFERALAERVAE